MNKLFSQAYSLPMPVARSTLVSFFKCLFLHFGKIFHCEAIPRLFSEKGETFLDLSTLSMEKMIQEIG